MTTITIDIPDPQADALTARARAQGLTLEDWFRQVAEKEAAPSAKAPSHNTDPEEWVRKLDSFVASLPKTPVLSDKAMSRESIYFDRN